MTSAWHDELILTTDLARANKQITTYILRALDADAGQATPTHPAEEHALGVLLVELGNTMQARAKHRATITGSTGTVVIDISADTDREGS